jgi:hypothetical protein
MVITVMLNKSVIIYAIEIRNKKLAITYSSQTYRWHCNSCWQNLNEQHKENNKNKNSRNCNRTCSSSSSFTGTYAATTQQAFASSPCSHLKAIKGGKIACSTVEQKAKIDQQQSVNDDDNKSNDAKDKGRSYDANDDDSLDVSQSEEASISQFALSSASVN